MATHDKVSQMAMQLIYGTPEEKKITVDAIMATDPDEMVNILEVSREVVFENSGDEKLAFATNSLIDFIYMVIGLRTMKGSYIRNAH